MLWPAMFCFSFDTLRIGDSPKLYLSENGSQTVESLWALVLALWMPWLFSDPSTIWSYSYLISFDFGCTNCLVLREIIPICSNLFGIWCYWLIWYTSVATIGDYSRLFLINSISNSLSFFVGAWLKLWGDTLVYSGCSLKMLLENVFY